MVFARFIRSAGTFAALSLPLAAPSATHAQGFVGKTIIAQYVMTVTLCKAATGCEEIVRTPVNQNSYFGRRGEFFDYASNRTGERRPLGQAFVIDEVSHRWDLRGNQFVYTTVNAVGDVITIRHTLRGDRCQITGDVRKGPKRVGELRVRFDTLRCEVREGLQER